MTLLELIKIHTFYDQSHVIRGVSLQVEEGEAVALLGRNGSGKTTTLRSIMGLTPVRMGKIVFRGTNIEKSSCHSIAHKGIQYVPENRCIFSELTVKENLMIVSTNIERVGSFSLENVLALFPKLRGLQRNLGKTLSGGEQQMLAIGRALMGNPELLLLDEPCEGLAPLVKKELASVITQIKKETTILLVEQNVNFAFSVLDRGYIIDKGIICFEGSKERILADRELCSEYLAI